VFTWNGTSPQQEDSASSGLDGLACLKEEIMELRGQVVTLQSQVDILSKVFLFIDV
jgi:hypothetical protein